MRAISVLMVLLFSIISARLVQVQALGADWYSNRGLRQRLATVPLPAVRGSIFDRNGRDLAISVERKTVWADPSLVSDPAGTAATLAPIVGTDLETLVARLSQTDKRFVYVARTVDDAVADEVLALGLAGVGFIPESKRYYPAGSVAAPVVGEVGAEGSGTSGLEYMYEDLLAGKDGEIEVERDLQGMEIPRTERSRVGPERGTDVVLTIDQDLQYQVESSLVDQVTATRAKGGTAVVLDVRTGDVVAMATIDGASGAGPAHPAGPDAHNRPLTDVFEPGSTNKVITIAAALDDGVVGPWTEFDVPDWIRVGDSTFTDHDGHPVMRWSTTDILRESSNVGTIQIAQALGKERLDAALRAFGLGEPTAVDFPGQADGILLDPDDYYSTGIGAVPIGYGVAVSLLQMVDVYATIANDGVTRPARLVGATIAADGNRRVEPIESGERIVRPETAASLTQMLTEVVRGGTGACAAVSGYTTAGKTGTSLKQIEGDAGYSDEYFASFIGFAPAEEPRFAAAVVLDDPNSVYGSQASAPVFSEIMRSALRLDGVVPPPVGAGPTQWDQAAETARLNGWDCRVPHGTALDDLVAASAAAEAEAEIPNGETLADAGTLVEPTSPTG